MGTASSMAILCEALGLMVPGREHDPGRATRARRDAAAEAGRRAVAAVRDGPGRARS